MVLWQSLVHSYALPVLSAGAPREVPALGGFTMRVQTLEFCYARANPHG
ncbi:hypothetical protein ARSEF1564_000270 [Beauveria bassiana]